MNSSLLTPIIHHSPVGIDGIDGTGVETSSRLGALVISTAVGAGVVGGVLFAFSTFVMPALDRLPAAEGISAMQAINRAAPNPLFMFVLFGTAVASIVIAISALSRWGQPGTRLQLLAAALYLVTIVVTAMYHVPHNDALALVDPHATAAGPRWSAYVAGWTAWNHVRALTAIAAATLLTMSRRVPN